MIRLNICKSFFKYFCFYYLLYTMTECTCTVCKCTNGGNECTCATSGCSCTTCTCEWCSKNQ